MKANKLLTKIKKKVIINSVDAPVAQLDRVLGYEPNGREFESLRVHQMELNRTPIYLALLSFCFVV